MTDKITWKTVERPGYFGKKRDELVAKCDKEYGKGNWRLAYQWGILVIEREQAIQIYEDAYYEFLKNNPKTLEWLVNTASDVYDTAPSNVEARFDYNHQETPNTHLQDIAIRKSVMRLGKWFKGEHLVEIRSKSKEGRTLSPGIVPFHLPEMIVKEEIKDYGEKGMWWQNGSIEDFYQRNKLLQVKEK